MRVLLFLLFISVTKSQDGSNASNTTTNGQTNTTTTTTLRGVTTTLAYTTTPGSTTTPLPSTHNPTQGATTTGWPVGTTTVKPIPYCSGNVSYNGTCKVCLGPLCKFVENGEQGVGWEIIFVAAFLTFSGFSPFFTIIMLPVYPSLVLYVKRVSK